MKNIKDHHAGDQNSSGQFNKQKGTDLGGQNGLVDNPLRRAVLDDFVEPHEPAQNLFTNPPEMFDPDLVNYQIDKMHGTSFVEALKHIVDSAQ